MKPEKYVFRCCLDSYPSFRACKKGKKQEKDIRIKYEISLWIETKNRDEIELF